MSPSSPLHPVHRVACRDDGSILAKACVAVTHLNAIRRHHGHLEIAVVVGPDDGLVVAGYGPGEGDMRIVVNDGA
jgi:hypothetical protein